MAMYEHTGLQIHFIISIQCVNEYLAIYFDWSTVGCVELVWVSIMDSIQSCVSRLTGMHSYDIIHN